MSTPANVTKLLLCADFIAYGQPEKKLLDEVLRKRGYLKTSDHKRVPISDNTLIEELLGSHGLICIEDVIDAFWSCKKNEVLYEAARAALWPIQLAPRKDKIVDKSVKFEEINRTYRKQIVNVSKGGYLGHQGAAINDYVRGLI